MSATVAAVAAARARRNSSAQIRTQSYGASFDLEVARLEFCSAVLLRAEDRGRPLAERVRFLAMLSDSLDDFFQGRPATDHAQPVAPMWLRSSYGMTADEHLDSIGGQVPDLVERRSAVFNGDILPGLQLAGFRLVNPRDLSSADHDLLTEVFQDRIFPVLTPLAVDSAHPFPYISNLSLNLAVLVADPTCRQPRFARVKVPPLLPRFIRLRGGERFILLEEVMALHLSELFPEMEIVGHHCFRVTRTADVRPASDETRNLATRCQPEFLGKHRTSRAVRLEVGPDMSPEVLSVLLQGVELAADRVYFVTEMLDLTSWLAVNVTASDPRDISRHELMQQNVQGPVGLQAI